MKLLTYIFVVVLLYGLIVGHIGGVLIAAGFLMFIQWADRQFEKQGKEHSKTRESD